MWMVVLDACGEQPLALGHHRVGIGISPHGLSLWVDSLKYNSIICVYLCYYLFMWMYKLVGTYILIWRTKLPNVKIWMYTCLLWIELEVEYDLLLLAVI